MTSAVAEAHRVLRPDGVLLDIHPEPVPMRLEIWTLRAGCVSDDEQADPADYHRAVLGDFVPSEHTDDFALATQALATAEALGFTGRESRPFEYRHVFSSLDELTDYLEENEELDLAGDDLLERALMAMQSATQPARLALIQFVRATRLVKPPG